jgi:hypothetical protein
MAEVTLSKTRIHAGIWEGVLTGGASVPGLEVTHLDRPVAGVRITAHEGGHTVRVPIPAELLSDGVQTFLIRDTADDRTLAHFTVITGVAMEDDLRAEIDLLRAELDLLKRAFRRHCAETAT